MTIVVVLILLAIVGLAGMLVPAWRATRIDPVAILRRGPWPRRTKKASFIAISNQAT